MGDMERGLWKCQTEEIGLNGRYWEGAMQVLDRGSPGWMEVMEMGLWKCQTWWDRVEWKRWRGGNKSTKQWGPGWMAEMERLAMKVLDRGRLGWMGEGAVKIIDWVKWERVKGVINVPDRWDCVELEREDDVSTRQGETVLNAWVGVVSLLDRGTVLNGRDGEGAIKVLDRGRLLWVGERVREQCMY